MKYFVYKISGGLNHMLGEINNSVTLSKITNRKLIIDTYCYTFSNDFNKYFYIPDVDYSTNYDELEFETYNKYKTYIKSNVSFQPPKDNNPSDYLLKDISAHLNSENIINSKEDLIFFTYLRNMNDIIYKECKSNWYIKLRDNILSDIKKYGEIEGDYIGLHFRNTDMKSDLSKLTESVKKYTYKIKKIYFATDDINGLEDFKKLISPEIEIIQYIKPFDAKGKGIHYGNPNKDEVILNSLVDMYYLSKSTHFIGSPKSSFSQRIESIRESKVDLF